MAEKRVPRSPARDDAPDRDSQRARDALRGLTQWRRIAPITGLLACALGLRLTLILQLAATPVFHAHFSDTRMYLEMAASMFSGGAENGVFFMSPLYPALLAAVQSIFGETDLVIRIIQALLGTMTVGLTYALARRIFGARAGWIAAVWAAIQPELLWYDASLLSESLLTVLCAGSLLLLVRSREDSTPRMTLAAGLVCGALIVGRATFAILPLVWMGVLFLDARRQALRPAVLFFTALIIALLPTALHNLQAERVFVPVTSSAGFNLYAGNNASCKGFYSVPEDIDLVMDPGGRAFASIASGRTLNAAEASSYWGDRAWSWITHNPGTWMTLLGTKLLFVFRAGEIEQIGLGPDFIRHEYATLLDIPLPGFGWILSFAVAGMVFALRGRVRHAGMLTMIAVLSAVTIAIFFVATRFRVPFTPLLLAFAGYGISELWRTAAQSVKGASNPVRMLIDVWKGGMRGAGWPVRAAIIAVLCSTVLQPDVSGNFSLEYTRLGQCAFDQGSYLDAARLFERSLAEKETVQALVNLGNAKAVLGDASAAQRAYDRALTIDARSHLALFNLGNLAMQLGNIRAAAALWKRAIEVNAAFAPAHRNLGLLLLRAGRMGAARRQLEEYLELERNPRAREEIRRDLHAAADTTDNHLR